MANNAPSKSALGRSGLTRRRWLSLIALSAVMAIAIPWWIVSAGAAVSNPGPVTISLHDGVFHTALADFSPLTGTMTGSVDASGNIAVSQANISFTPVTVNVAGLDITVTPTASSNWTGTINPDTGQATLSGQLTTNLAIAALGVTACPLGPVSLSLSTSNTGGAPYSPTTGDSTLVDDTFTIPAIPAGQVGCGGQEGLINGALPLPSAPGAVTLTTGALFSPAPQGTTSTSSSASTSSTSASTTSTTASTTTTTGPTTTTTGSTTTTTGSTTTTTGSTTTTTGPTTTTSTTASTTTTVPQTSTSTTPGACKPGWGFGDKNHKHCGPPGQTGQHPQSGHNTSIRGRLISATRPDGGKGAGVVVASSAVAGLALVLRRRRRSLS
jgi:hypothetical protein